MKWTAIALALALLLPAAAWAENKLWIGVKGNHRSWTGIHGDMPKELEGTPFLQKVYRLLSEETFHAYLVQQIQRTPGDVWITLVDDTLPGAHKVWPHARGRQFLVSESWFEKYVRQRGVQAIRGLLAHELAHTQDRAHSLRGAYGLDGIHSREEMITQRAAMIEGWANYQAIPFSPWLEAAYRSPHLADEITKEDPEDKGEYHRRTLRTFADWMRVEAGVSRVLHELAVRSPAGRARVSEAFDATNDGKVRTLPRLLRVLAERQPELALKYATLVDAVTDFSATDAELVDLFGEGGRVYVRTWRKLERRS